MNKVNLKQVLKRITVVGVRGVSEHVLRPMASGVLASVLLYTLLVVIKSLQDRFLTTWQLITMCAGCGAVFVVAHLLWRVGCEVATTLSAWRQELTQK